MQDTRAPADCTPATAESLAQLAKQAAQASTPEAGLAAVGALRSMVYRCLHQGKPQDIQAALASLARLPGAQPLNILRAYAEFAAQRLLYAKGTSSLFVVPLLGVFPNRPATESGALATPTLVDALPQALRTTELVSPTAFIAMVPYLYHPEELLGLPLVEVADLHKTILHSAVNGEPATTARLAQTGWPAPALADRSTFHLGLRFLIGVVFDNNDNPVFRDDVPDTITPEYEAQLNAILHTIEPSCQQMVGTFGAGPRLQLLSPQLFFQGTRRGAVETNQLALDLALGACIENAKMHPRGALAVISPVTEGGSRVIGVAVTLLSRLTGEVLTTEQRSLLHFEEAASAIEQLAVRLRLNVGVGTTELALQIPTERVPLEPQSWHNRYTKH